MSLLRSLYGVFIRSPEFIFLAISTVGIIAYTAVMILSPQRGFMATIMGYSVVAAAVASIVVARFVPLTLYIAIFASMVSLIVTNRSSYVPEYFLSLEILSASLAFFIKPIEFTSPRIVTVSMAVRRAVKGARLPRSVEEAKISLYVMSPALVCAAVSAILFIMGYVFSLIPMAYSVAIFASVMLNIGARKEYMIRERPGSIFLAFAFKYDFLIKMIEGKKPKISALSEEAGRLLDERAYIARFVTLFFMIITAVPATTSMIYIVTGGPAISLASGLLLVAASYIVYRMPEISLRLEVARRGGEAEDEFPFFVAYLLIMISGGMAIIDAMERLSLDKRSGEVMKRFHRESMFISRLRQVYNLTPSEALRRYAERHPSQSVKAMINGYLGQLAAGGNLVLYLSGVLSESLKVLQAKIELLGRRLQIMIMIIVMGVGMPVIVAVISLMLNPESAAPLLYTMNAGVIPGLAAFLLATAKPMRDYGRVRQIRIATPIVGVIAVISSIYTSLNIFNAILIAIASIAVSNYIEFRYLVRKAEVIDNNLKLMFFHLRELRNSYPLNKAIEILSDMDIPEELREVVSRIRNMIRNNIKISEQPWHSTSKLWKIAQFYLSKIEETGGGTPLLFTHLGDFFSSYVTISNIARMELRIYEFVIYALIGIIGIVYAIVYAMMSTISGLFTAADPGAIAAIQQTGAAGGILQIAIQGIPTGLTDLIVATIIEVAVVLGLAAGKLIDYSIWSTRVLAIASVVAFIAVNYFPPIVRSIFMIS